MDCAQLPKENADSRVQHVHWHERVNWESGISFLYLDTCGPNNVFDAGVGGVPFLFRISVALLVALEIAGLWGAAHALVGLIRSNTSNRSCRRRLVQQANGNDSSCFRPAELEEKNPGEGNAGARRPAEGVNASRRIHGMSAF